MKMTTIQVSEKTRRRIAERKLHPGESYEEVLKRMLEEEGIPTMEEMFAIADKRKPKRTYTTQEVIDISHELRKG